MARAKPAKPPQKKRKPQKGRKTPRNPTTARKEPESEVEPEIPFSDSSLGKGDVKETIKRACPTEEELQPYHSMKLWRPERTILKPEDVPNRASQVKNKRELRVISAFTFWKYNAEYGRNVQAPVPIAGEDLSSYELRGMVASLNGPYRFCAMAGELKVDYPLRDSCPIWIKYGNIESVGLVSDPSFRDG
ncbi:hypothetical protein RSAG8_13048, partial [Rhizoctonia solani AG-8 WAC10335]